MKKFTTIDGKEVKLLKRDQKSREGHAYAMGSLGNEMSFDFDFEKTYWLKGEADAERIRKEIKENLR